MQDLTWDDAYNHKKMESQKQSSNNNTQTETEIESMESMSDESTSNDNNFKNKHRRRGRRKIDIKQIIRAVEMETNAHFPIFNLTQTSSTPKGNSEKNSMEITQQLSQTQGQGTQGQGQGQTQEQGQEQLGGRNHNMIDNDYRNSRSMVTNRCNEYIWSLRMNDMFEAPIYNHNIIINNNSNHNSSNALSAKRDLTNQGGFGGGGGMGYNNHGRSLEFLVCVCVCVFLLCLLAFVCVCLGLY